MPSLELIDSGVIYRNSNPGYRYIFPSHSHPVELSATELICPFHRGEAMYAADLRFAISRSTDGGKTWQFEGLIHDGATDALPYSYHDPMPTLLADGTVVISAFRIDRTDAERPLFHESNGGLVPVELVLFRSADGGRTWSAPEVIATLHDPVLTPSSSIVELANGNWFLPFDRWHGFDNPGPYRPLTVGWFSTDHGATWGDPVEYADGAPQDKAFWHGKVIRLGDDRLFSLFWSAAKGAQSTLTLHRCFGSADGRTWSVPEATNLMGQTNFPVDLGNAQMAAIYTDRESAQPGERVALSLDGGGTWDLDNQVLVWDATGRDKLGVVELESYPRSHDSIAFGAPTAMRLANGDIYTSWWCTEMSVTQLRYARLRVV